MPIFEQNAPILDPQAHKLGTSGVLSLLNLYMKLKAIVSLLFLLLSFNGQAQPSDEVIKEIVNTINEIRAEGCKCGRKDRFDDFGYRWQFAGENLGEGQESFQEVVRDWLASPSHCRMIMNPDMTEMGLAKRGKYWVQHFGKLIPENYKRTNTRYSEGN